MSHDAELGAAGRRASGCPRCKPGPCVIARAATMADLSDGVRVRDRYGPWPMTGTARVIESGSELIVQWDPRPWDGMHVPSSPVLAEGPPTLGGVLLEEIELMDPAAAAVSLAAAVQAVGEAIAAGPCLIMLIGPAGSGKSTLARDAAGDSGQVLSLDALRAAVSGDECDQSATGEAVKRLHRLADYRLGNGLPTVIDATNVDDFAREPLLAIADRHGVPAVAVILATSLQECLARNATRPGPPPGARWGRRVPEHVVRSQHHARLLVSAPSLAAEGFTRVITCTPDDPGL
jgi:predicted kinase